MASHGADRSLAKWVRSAGLGTTTALIFSSLFACAEVDPNSRELPGELPIEPASRPRLLSTEPPPISRGTLLLTRDDATVVAADSDRDSVWLFDANWLLLRTRVRLAPGAEPGRVVEDQDGKIHVALRRGGQIVKLDPRTGEILSQRSVCAAPRGLAYDPDSDNLHVACAAAS